MQRLPLNTPESTRKTFARAIREYYAGKMPERTFRTLVYGLSNYLSYWKLLKDIEIENRIEAIEKQLENKR